ncbi:solute carrier organic anion transporter family member 4A1-like [Acropora muricata]|uniref:solute carrier organic anion transporter family member 4A1-like n=1 Tax=Acropora muricata TaxID=159855 RepID=UPI0034E3C978
MQEQRDAVLSECRPACGLLSWRPRFLQRFAEAKWFLVFQCWFVLAQGMIVSGLSGVVISSLERRFSLKTNEVGAIVSCYDIAAAVMAVVVSYYGHHHKPKWLGMGAFILGIGCFLFALPHVLVGSYEPGSSGTNFCTPKADPTDSGCKSSIWYHILAFVIAEFFIGVGATPVYILGPSYIDENVRHSTSGLFLGIMYAVASLGPAIGFLLGGEFLNIYVDINQPDGSDLSPEDPPFIGAWWLGYIVGGILSILVSLPLLAFPEELPGTPAIRAEKKGCSDYMKDDNMPHTLKQLLPMLKSLLTNKPFVFVALAGTFEGFVVSGFSTFMPKFVETQFHVSPGKAATYTGIVVVLGGCSGMLFGGYLIKRMNWTCDKIIKASFIIAVLATLWVFGMFFGCSNREFIGVTKPYLDSASVGNLSASCNAACNCDVKFFSPICSQDDLLTFYSPCFAGCTAHDVLGDKSYHNCSCFPNPLSKGIEGSGCIPECNSLIPFLFFLFGLMVFTFSNNIPATTATLRCVPESQGSFALGINQLIIRIFAFIPAPIVFGYIIDAACRLHQEDPCDSQAERNCLEYDADLFRYLMVAMGGIFKALSAVAFFFAWKTYKLPNTTNRQDSTPSDVASQITIADGHASTEKFDIELSPPVQQITVMNSSV